MGKANVRIFPTETTNKQVEVLKEKQENTTKQVMEMNKNHIRPKKGSKHNKENPK